MQEGSFVPSGLVEVECQGNDYVAIRASEFKTKQTVRKLSKEDYLVLSTGEVKKYGKKNSVKVNENLRKTFSKLRGLIRTNFDSKSKNQLFVTLTYKENMTDSTRLYRDFDKFVKRLRYKYKKCKFEYIAVAEPQKRGAWHFHVMLKDTANAVLYINCDDIERIWGLGASRTERLKSDEVGSYYSSYFTDILEEGKSKLSERKKKKGARLHMYPVGFKFYRCSRGIKKPSTYVANIIDVESEYSHKVYSSSFDLIVFDEGVLDERIANRFYKAERRRKTEKKKE